MPLVRFEPAVPAGERPQTYAVDRVAARIGWNETARMNTADTMGWITVTVAMVLPCSGWWGLGGRLPRSPRPTESKWRQHKYVFFK